LLQILIPELMHGIELGDIEGLLEHPPAGCQQQQVVVDQSCGEGLGVPTQQRTTATDHPHAAIPADLQIRSSQAAGLPEALQEAFGTILITAGKGQHPAKTAFPWRWIQQRKAHLRADPIGQFITELKTRQSEGTIPQLLNGIPRIPALLRRCYSLGVGRKTPGVDEPMQAEGRLTGNETGCPRQRKWLLRESQRTLLRHRPPQASRSGDHHHHCSGNCEKKGAGLHGPAIRSLDDIFIHLRVDARGGFRIPPCLTPLPPAFPGPSPPRSCSDF